MKKIIFFLLTLCLFSCKQADEKGNVLSTIVGKWERKKPEAVLLYTIEKGKVKEIARAVISEDSSFSFGFRHQVPEMFVIGTGDSHRDKYAFFFKPGDQLNIVVNDSSYLLMQENTNENLEIEKWHNFILPLEIMALYDYSSTYVDFFPILETKYSEAKTYKSDYTRNPDFNKSFDLMRKFDLAYFALYFTGTPRPAHPHKDDFIDCYKEFALKELCGTNDILSYPNGKDILSYSEFIVQALNPYHFSENEIISLRSGMEAMDLRLSLIKDEEVKGEYLLEKTKYIKTYDGYIDFGEKYSDFFKTSSQKERFVDLSASFENKVGETAFNFTLKDIHDKSVSLSDYKGKVVYIDIWATWCGPCKMELPYLKKLEEKYRKENIVFMQISVDQQKDIQKWKDAVKSENLKGVQLFAGNKVDLLRKAYKYTGIPRFIVIDKEGKLVSGDAPRPSSQEIDIVLKNTLKK